MPSTAAVAVAVAVAVADAGSIRRRRADSPEPPEPDSSEPRRERCPRCSSRDTKFCYYNNYNTSQPRHFCKSCRRYWTLGGSLRNGPVGGSSRKRLRPAAAAPPPPPPSSAAAAAPPPPSLDVGLSPLPVGFPPGLSEAILDRRIGFDLGLGLGLGPGPLLWPLSLFEDEVVGDTWRMDGGAEAFGAAAVWKDVGFSPPVDGGAGGGGAPERKVH